MGDIEYGARVRVAEIKSADDSYEVAGYVATYGNVDHSGDVVCPGAFDHCLGKQQPIRFLAHHDTKQVLGRALELKSDATGLFGRFKISQTQLGRDIHTLLKDGALDSFSIGYVPTEVEFDGDARLLKSIDLLECSVVAMPMNARAMVTAVKSDAGLVLHDDTPFEHLLQQVATHLTKAAEAAEALQARRAADGRKLAEAHIDAIRSLLDQAEASSKRLELIASPPSPPDDGIKTRLELARRLARVRGLLETV